MKEDDFCNAFDCIISMVFQEQCFTYTKEIFDVDCHLFCQLTNCTKVPIPEVYCPTYNCWPISTTTPSTITTTESPPIGPAHLGIIFGSVLGGLIFFGLILLAIFFVLKRRPRHEDEELQSNTNQPFVVATPSTSSSEDWESRPLQYFVRDSSLDREVDEILNREFNNSSESPGAELFPNVRSEGCFFNTFKNEIPGFQTTQL